MGRINRVTRVGRVARVGGGADPGKIILTITDDGGGNALVTTAGPHGIDGFAVDIAISGTSNELYNTEHVFLGAPSSTTFMLLTGWVGDSEGGTWRYV
jgi:hypothetical protein